MRGWGIRLSPGYPPPHALLFPCKCMNHTAPTGLAEYELEQESTGGRGLKISRHFSPHSQGHHTQLHSTWFIFKKRIRNHCFPTTPPSPRPPWSQSDLISEHSRMRVLSSDIREDFQAAGQCDFSHPLGPKWGPDWNPQQDLVPV